MRNVLGDYVVDLEARYGDPRQYAKEREEMIRDQARKQHIASRGKEELLQNAYEKQVGKNREKHANRIRRPSKPQWCPP